MKIFNRKVTADNLVVGDTIKFESRTWTILDVFDNIVGTKSMLLTPANQGVAGTKFIAVPKDEMFKITK